MADTKISALSAASTPLGGTEVLPIVQSSSTVNVSIANLTAGRNVAANSFTPGWTSTATAAGTTTLTVSSTYYQRFTGSTTQTVVLPAATAVAKGQGFIIDNDSSGNLTLQDGSAGALGSVVPGMAAFVFCEDNSTTAGSWSGYMFVPGGGPSGQVTWGTAGLSMAGQTISSSVLSNPTITNYVETLYAPSAGTAFTISLANGTIQEISLNGNGTLTLPSSVAGKSYTIIVTYSGAYTLTWAGGGTLKWAGGTAPTATSVSGKYDIFNFYCDGTNTYGSTFGLNY